MSRDTRRSSFSEFAGFPAEGFRYFAEVAADTSWETVERLQDLRARGPGADVRARLGPKRS